MRRTKARPNQTPCLACGDTPTDQAHVRSKKASGIDAEWNLIPLCRLDHIAQHAGGWQKFFKRFPHVREHLEGNGWKFEELMGRFLMFHESEQTGPKDLI